MELLQIVSGSLEVYLEKEHVTAMPGQVVILVPRRVHCGFSGVQGLTCNMIAFEPETKEDPHYPLYAHGKIYEIISLLYQHCTTDSRHVCKSSGKFGIVLEYINSHYPENISVKDISQNIAWQCGFSDVSYFSNRFKQHFEISPKNFRNALAPDAAAKVSPPHQTSL